MARIEDGVPLASYLPEALGLVVRELRAARTPRLTQQELGAAAGYKTGAGVAVSRIENGLTSPSPEHLDGLAEALGLDAHELVALAARRSEALRAAGGQPARTTAASLRDQLQQLQQTAQERRSRLAATITAFHAAHDKARDDFLLPFVETADGISGAPEPPMQDWADTVPDEDAGVEAAAEAAAEFRLRFTSEGVAQALSVAAKSARVGRAAGSAASYTAFRTAVTFGTSSTGVRNVELTGIAARNAALALLGGGTLAAGGRGVAGGLKLLRALELGPAILLAVGGGAWVLRRSQQQQLRALRDQVQTRLAVQGPAVEAFGELVARATQTLDYIAVHGAHAHERWFTRLQAPTDWTNLTTVQQQQYRDFIQLCAAQLAVATFDFTRLLDLEGEELAEEVAFLTQILDKSDALVRTIV